VNVVFPFKYITTNSFGKIFRPHAEIAVFSKSHNIYVKRTLIVDTGADFTIFPRKNAFLFGIDLQKEATAEESSGIGGRETIFLYRNLPIMIGDVKLTIPVGFLNRNDVPALLGRQACLELFRLSFERHRTIIQRD